MPVHNLLTTLQNGARARIRSIPLPYSNAALGITSILLQHGFIHNVTRGTLQGPSPANFLDAGPAARRLWVDLKYGHDDHPVLGHALPVSKPSRKIHLDARELLRLVTGRRAQFVSPLQLGEIAVVRCKAALTASSAAKGQERAGRQAAAAAASVSGTASTGTTPTMAATSAQVSAGQRVASSSSPLSSTSPFSPASAPRRPVEEWLEAREAVGRGLGGEVVARIG